MGLTATSTGTKLLDSNTQENCDYTIALARQP